MLLYEFPYGGEMTKELTIEHINTGVKLGVALKRLRKQAGLTQDELAKMVNMRQATVSDLENGRGTIDSLFKLIQILKLNLVLSNQANLQSAKQKTKASEVLDLLSD